ncbi:putative Glycosyltransferase [uncultured Woeseiaceae bacterium]|uniref:Putative Glycosyltransferase n=1 Tax=uncultured Woeseiaceae bacterium TaxID=1983305 RepID=A0A7D9D2T0_9GAMM|nr:putative Glycosyltransferase [uncultured Woeseiaceae bacterium]
MKVLLLNYEFPPAGGGAGYATKNIARCLHGMGIAVEILTARIEGKNDVIDLDGVSVHRVISWRQGLHDCGLRGAYTYVMAAALKRRKLHAQNRYDLEHFFFSLPTGLLSLLPGPRRPVPSVVSIRGSDVPGYDPFNRKVEIIHSVTKPVTRQIWRRADKVVSLSEALANIARDTSPNIDYDIIPNGVDEVHFAPPKSREESPRLRLVTVARLLERKGIQVIIEAFAKPEKLPAELTIVGTGSFEETLREQVDAMGIHDRVHFSGYIANDKLPELYHKMDAFVLPSETESFGLVFTEAMSCELPILASNVGGIPETVRNGVDGLLCPAGRPDLLRANIEVMIENRDARVGMGKSGRRRVLNHYTWNKVAQRYLDTYMSVLNPDSSPGRISEKVERAR